MTNPYQRLLRSQIAYHVGSALLSVVLDSNSLSLVCRRLQDADGVLVEVRYHCIPTRIRIS